MSDEATIYETGDFVYTISKDGEVRQFIVGSDGLPRLRRGNE
jgi:hypothetical protein